MLTLITGVPGSGKTLLAVSSVIPEYSAQQVEFEGEKFKRRVLVDGIKDLIIDHEMMPPTKIVTEIDGRNTTEVAKCDGEGVANWWEWCKPGDVIVIDEVQRMWRPRGNGSKVPMMVEMLETHRHMGVDFVILTQHPMLLDQNVRRLIGRHIHIRRMWGGSRAVRYEWDHCSSPEKVGDAGKSYWPYPKDAFKYYKSAEVHTKQGGKVPAALLVLALSVVALPVMAYVGVTRVQEMLHPAKPAHQVAQKIQSKEQAPDPAELSLAKSAGSAPVVTKTETVTYSVDTAMGCMKMAERCECYDGQLKRIAVPAATCEIAAHRVGILAAPGKV